ncbi:MAG: lipB [Thermoleophilia bacterium]|nr:lipB [Thermoleophilia bacterium]
MPTRASLPLRSCRLGRVEYVDTARLQRSLRAAREDRATDDVLLLLEHDPVITCGTRTEVVEVAFARTTDVPLVAVERGGKATYHGPGQVVAYPIFGIDVVGGDVKRLVWLLEQSIVDVLRIHGVETGRRDGLPGVWVEPTGARPRKIASVGLRLTRGVTFHGIAVNVACDLEPFTWFTPCGIPDAEMTSLARERGLDDAPATQLAELVASVEADLERAIAGHFGMRVAGVTPAELEALAAEHPVEAPDLALPGEARRAATTTRIDLAAGAPS